MCNKYYVECLHILECDAKIEWRIIYGIMEYSMETDVRYWYTDSVEKHLKKSVDRYIY